jgi:hypothetical protein
MNYGWTTNKRRLSQPEIKIKIKIYKVVHLNQNYISINHQNTDKEIQVNKWINQI